MEDFIQNKEIIIKNIKAIKEGNANEKILLFFNSMKVRKLFSIIFFYKFIRKTYQA